MHKKTHLERQNFGTFCALTQCMYPVLCQANLESHKTGLQTKSDGSVMHKNKGQSILLAHGTIGSNTSSQALVFRKGCLRVPSHESTEARLCDPMTPTNLLNILWINVVII